MFCQRIQIFIQYNLIVRPIILIIRLYEMKFVCNIKLEERKLVGYVIGITQRYHFFREVKFGTRSERTLCSWPSETGTKFWVSISGVSLDSWPCSSYAIKTSIQPYNVRDTFEKRAMHALAWGQWFVYL